MSKKNELQNRISDAINICACQRYFERILVPLKTLAEKLINVEKKDENNWYLSPEECTDSELFLIALLDRRCAIITHGINIEYPIAMIEDWKVLLDQINEYNNTEDI